MIVRRAATYDPSQSSILWQDGGPGTWGFSNVSSGLVEVTFPEPFLGVNSFALLVSEFGIGSPNSNASYCSAHSVTATGCRVYLSTTSNTPNSSGRFTIEAVGEV